SPAMTFRSVDFPEPFDPISPTNSPAGTVTVTSSSAFSISTSPYRKSEMRRSASVVCRSCGMRNVFETPRTSRAFIELEVLDQPNLEPLERRPADEQDHERDDRRLADAHPVGPLPVDDDLAAVEHDPSERIVDHDPAPADGNHRVRVDDRR